MKRTILILMMALGVVLSGVSIALSFEDGGGTDQGNISSVAIGPLAGTFYEQSVAIGTTAVTLE